MAATPKNSPSLSPLKAKLNVTTLNNPSDNTSQPPTATQEKPKLLCSVCFFSFLLPLSLSLSLSLSVCLFQISKMQSAAFTLSPSLSLPLRNHSLNSSRPSLPLRLFAKHTEGVNSNVASSTSFLRRSWTLSPSPSSSFKFRPLPPSPPRAAENAVPDSAPAENSQLLKTLQLGALFGLWYLFNIYFNIYNKQVLPQISPCFKQLKNDFAETLSFAKHALRFVVIYNTKLKRHFHMCFSFFVCIFCWN